MAKFIIPEQEEILSVRSGVSGLKYDSYKGSSFEVDNEADIAYFENNKRYKKVLFKKEAPVVDEAKIEADFLSELKGIKGVSEKVAGDIVNVYPTKESLITALEQGDIGTEVPKKVQGILIKNYIDLDIKEDD
jgi:hypothetical protein